MPRSPRKRGIAEPSTNTPLRITRSIMETPPSAQLSPARQNHLSRYAPVDAYMLCSVCADLRISSIVDVPNWVVSFYFPRMVLE